MLNVSIILLLLPLVYSYKVLVYAPQISRSHVTFMTRVAETLAEVGNDVVIYSPQFLHNVSVPNLYKSRLIEKKRTFPIGDDVNKFVTIQWQQKEAKILNLLQMKLLTAHYFTELCESVLSDSNDVHRLREEHFELGLAETIDPCGIALFTKIGLKKYIGTDSLNLNEYVTTPLGVENNPSYVPTLFSPYSDVMSYSERIRNFALYIFSKRAIQKAAFLMVNSEEYLDYPRPITNKIIYIGGIGARKPEPLNEYYKNLLDNSKDGAVFVSFGSILKSETMPPETKNHFLQTFRNFPKIQFIWKYESNDTLGDDIKNLIKVKWAPQNDLLRHPNIRAFVTHGGLNSISETVNAGVPAVVIPMFGDQFRNAKMVAKRGVARIVIKNNITSTSLTEALSAVLYDRKYRDSSSRLKRMIESKPTSAVERLVKYAEFAFKFGHVENLDSASTQLNFLQYYLIDITVPFALILATVVFLTCLLCKQIVRCISSRKVKND